MVFDASGWPEEDVEREETKVGIFYERKAEERRKLQIEIERAARAAIPAGPEPSAWPEIPRIDIPFEGRKFGAEEPEWGPKITYPTFDWKRAQAPLTGKAPGMALVRDVSQWLPWRTPLEPSAWGEAEYPGVQYEVPRTMEEVMEAAARPKPAPTYIPSVAGPTPTVPWLSPTPEAAVTTIPAVDFQWENLTPERLGYASRAKEIGLEAGLKYTGLFVQKLGAESGYNPFAVNRTATEHSVGIGQHNIINDPDPEARQKELFDPETNMQLARSKWAALEATFDDPLQVWAAYNYGTAGFQRLLDRAGEGWIYNVANPRLRNELIALQKMLGGVEAAEALPGGVAAGTYVSPDLTYKIGELAPGEYALGAARVIITEEGEVVTPPSLGGDASGWPTGPQPTEPEIPPDLPPEIQAWLEDALAGLAEIVNTTLEELNQVDRGLQTLSSGQSADASYTSLLYDALAGALGRETTADADLEALALRKDELEVEMMRLLWMQNLYTNVPSYVQTGQITDLASLLEHFPFPYATEGDLTSAGNALSSLIQGIPIRGRLADIMEIYREREKPKRAGLRVMETMTSEEIFKALRTPAIHRAKEGFPEPEVLGAARVLGWTPEQVERRMAVQAALLPMSAEWKQIMARSQQRRVDYKGLSLPDVSTVTRLGRLAKGSWNWLWWPYRQLYKHQIGPTAGMAAHVAEEAEGMTEAMERRLGRDIDIGPRMVDFVERKASEATAAGSIPGSILLRFAAGMLRLATWDYPPIGPIYQEKKQTLGTRLGAGEAYTEWMEDAMGWESILYETAFDITWWMEVGAAAKAWKPIKAAIDFVQTLPFQPVIWPGKKILGPAARRVLNAIPLAPAQKMAAEVILNEADYSRMMKAMPLGDPQTGAVMRETVEGLIPAARAAPNAADDGVQFVSRLLRQHRPLEADDVIRWSDDIGGKITRETPDLVEIVEKVDGIYESGARLGRIEGDKGVKVADAIVAELGAEPTDAAVKRMNQLITDRTESIINDVKRIFADNNPRMQLNNLAIRTRGIIETQELSRILDWRSKRRVVGGILGGLDSTVIRAWRKVQPAIRHSAVGNLVYAAIGPGNLAETAFQSMMHGGGFNLSDDALRRFGLAISGLGDVTPPLRDFYAATATIKLDAGLDLIRREGLELFEQSTSKLIRNVGRAGKGVLDRDPRALNKLWDSVIDLAQHNPRSLGGVILGDIPVVREIFRNWPDEISRKIEAQLYLAQLTAAYKNTPGTLFDDVSRLADDLAEPLRRHMPEKSWATWKREIVDRGMVSPEAVQRMNVEVTMKHLEAEVFDNIFKRYPELELRMGEVLRAGFRQGRFATVDGTTDFINNMLYPSMKETFFQQPETVAWAARGIFDDLAATSPANAFELLRSLKAGSDAYNFSRELLDKTKWELRKSGALHHVLSTDRPERYAQINSRILKADEVLVEGQRQYAKAIREVLEGKAPVVKPTAIVESIPKLYFPELGEDPIAGLIRPDGRSVFGGLQGDIPGTMWEGHSPMASALGYLSVGEAVDKGAVRTTAHTDWLLIEARPDDPSSLKIAKELVDDAFSRGIKVQLDIRGLELELFQPTQYGAVSEMFERAGRLKGAPLDISENVRALSLDMVDGMEREVELSTRGVADIRSWHADAIESRIRGPKLTGQAAHDEWMKISRELDLRWEQFRQEIRPHSRNVERLGQELNKTLTGYDPDILTPLAGAVDRELTPTDIARLFNMTADEAHLTLLAADAPDPEKWVRNVLDEAETMGRVHDVNPAEYGFTPDKVRQVRKQVITSLLSDPDADSYFSGVRLQLNSMENDINNYVIARREHVPFWGQKDEIQEAVARALPSIGGYGSEAWWGAKRSAAERAAREFYKVVTNYHAGNIVTHAIQQVFPYFTYTSQKYPRLAYTLVKHPGAYMALGRYQQHTEFGYIRVPGTSFEVSLTRGTFANWMTSTLMRQDYPEYWDNAPAGTTWYHFLKRYGFYAGIHVTAAQALWGAKDPSKRGQFGELLPPMWGSVIYGLGRVFPGNAAAKALGEVMFPTAFLDYLTSKGVAQKGYQGKVIYEKILLQDALSDEEQQVWDETKREMLGWQAFQEQVPLFRLKPQEQEEFQRLREELLTELTGIPPLEREALYDQGYRPLDLIGGLDLEQQRILRQLSEDYNWRWQGLTLPLKPTQEQVTIAKVDRFWRDIRSKREQMNQEGIVRDDGVIVPAQADLDESFLTGTLRGDQYLRQSAEGRRDFQMYIDLKMSSEEYQGLPLTWEQRVQWYKDHYGQAFTRHIAEEMVDYYFQIGVERVRDPETGNWSYDWDGYWAEIDAFRRALPEEQLKQFDEYLNRWTTPLQALYRADSEQYLKDYNMLSNVVLSKDFNREEQALIHEWRTTGERARREAIEEMQRFTRDPETGEKVFAGPQLIADFRNRTKNIRLGFRQANPMLDAKLNFWWKVSSFQTPEAEMLHQQLLDKYKK